MEPITPQEVLDFVEYKAVCDRLIERINAKLRTSALLVTAGKDVPITVPQADERACMPDVAAKYKAKGWFVKPRSNNVDDQVWFFSALKAK